MEKCDVVDEFGLRTGRVVIRGAEMATGDFYLVVHVWIRDQNGKYLVQQRALHLASGAGIWATTVGYVLAGEDSLDGAIREVKEEMGIQLSPWDLRRLDRHKMENRIEDIWLADVSRNSIGEPCLGSEVADWMWAGKAELEQRVSRGDFFAYSYLGDLPG